MLVVTACSDDGSGDDEEGGSFCTDAQEAVAEVGAQPDLEQLGEAWSEVDAEVPGSIAEDWDLVLERWDELADPPTEADIEALDVEEAEAAADRARELELAWRSVSSYLRDLCEMELP